MQVLEIYGSSLLKARCNEGILKTLVKLQLMQNYIIDKDLSAKVLMAGNYYKHHHPGGISAVVQYWSQYIENLQYYPTYKLSNVLVRIGWFVCSYFRLALRMLTDRNIKILHLHTAADGSFWRKSMLVNLGHRMGKKVILHVHASRFKDFYNESSTKKKQRILNTLNSVDVLIVLSQSWKEWFASLGIPQDKIVILHNITSYPVKIESAKVDDGKTHFLFMGEIGQRKGVFDILRALNNHRDEVEGRVELRIGGNRHEEELKKAITDGKLQNIVKFEGWVGGEKKLQLLNWADVFILPSFNEGLPISILEAMSYGHPVISTPVGGIPEVVETGKNGILVTPGKDEEIFEAINYYVAHRDKISEEGKRSKDVAQTYLPDYVLNHLKEIYQNLI